MKKKFFLNCRGAQDVDGKYIEETVLAVLQKNIEKVQETFLRPTLRTELRMLV